MSDSTAMVGELEITATAKLLKRPVHVSNSHHGTVYRYGDEEFTNVLPIHVKFTPMRDTMSPSCHRHLPTLKIVSHHLRVAVNHHQRQSYETEAYFLCMAIKFSVAIVQFLLLFAYHKMQGWIKKPL